MRPTLRAIIAVLAITGSVGCAESARGPAPAVGSRPALSCPAPCRWRSVALPRVGVTTEVTGMVAAGPTDVWVAMRTGRGWSDPQPGPDESWAMPPEHDVMLHWDGHRWRRVPLPQLHDPVTNLAARTPDDVWGVTESDGLIRWNGRHWRMHPVEGRRHGPELGRVAALARENAWLAAAGFTNRGSHALIEHWEGQRWTRVSAPTVSGERTKLTAIAAAGRNDVWAFGAYAIEHGDSHLIAKSGVVTEHWDGQRWSIVPERVYRQTKHGFEIHDAVMLSPTDGWAVGHQSAPFRPLIMHWNGTQWTTHLARGCCVLSALAARDPNDIWAAGYTSSDNRYQARVEHWNGHQWQTIATPVGGSTFLTSVSTLPGGEILVAGTTTDSNDTAYPVLMRFIG